VTYIYVGAGVTTKTWTVNLPATLGSYEFRLYYNNTYTRLASSPAIAVMQDLRGPWNHILPSSLTVASCTNPQRNGTFTPDGTSTLVIVTETGGGNFTGTMTLNSTISGLVPVRVQASLAGTVMPGAYPTSTLSGTLTFQEYENSILTFTGTGTFSGSSNPTLSPSQIFFAVNATGTVGETCQITGGVTFSP